MDTIIGEILIGGVDGTVYRNPVIIPGVLGNALYFESRKNNSADLGTYP